MLACTLDQGGGRKTGRDTIWRSTPPGWQIVFRQGTLIQDA